ncbi:glycosyl hydrolase family 18 protein [Aquibacillus rhizosphaerae]|uniref:Glycosyl hydrolase family 18 protein n=1 Tax=Aquibacillus rhizosphaerae TaxID=3051431 RepID=A0ABT7L140_9BACI|nr:glycosyl hydrolase family 18 protein [Aquibacillus sp. LR5S19]MDL4838897.1 glycosyl hydrolase family 18 protein [Aquibacillus sp. LR5S19]
MVFINEKLVHTEQGYEIHLYIDPNLEEFSSELGTKHKEQDKNIKVLASTYIKKNFPGLNIVTAKVIIGTTLIATIPLQQNEVNAHEATFNMTYSFFGSTTSVVNAVDQTHGNLDVISPSYFNINSDGSLLISGVDRKFIDEMNNRNIRVVPFLSNHWNRIIGRAALANREQLSTQIANAIKQYGFDGINVDIENVNEQDRDNFTDLVRLLREKVPKDKEVSVAIAANPNHWITGWHGSYDNKELVKYADYLMLMAYDESYQGGPAGPVASISWVEKSIKALVEDEQIDPNKVVLGLPFFGRYWNDSEEIGGYGASGRQVELLISKYNGVVTYDVGAQSPKANFTIKSTNDSTTIAGRTLKPGNYEVWYENNQSIKAKVDLVHKYNLKGTGSWSIGQENPTVWDNFGIWLTSHDSSVPVTDTHELSNPDATIFTDVTKNWAKDEILYVQQKGWFKGKTKTEFAPNDALTREEAAAVIVRVLSLQPLQPFNKSFSDVSTSSWAYEPIEIARQHKVFLGKGDGTFGYNEVLTREQMASILNNILKNGYDFSKTSNPVEFRDVSKKSWSYDAIVSMKQQGIFQGVSATKFNPKGKVSRAQMAKVLTNASFHLMEYKGESPFERILKNNNEGADVTFLQIQLKKLGYYNRDASVVFDSSTDHAVRSFQADHELTVDGIVGPSTIGKLLLLLNWS